MNNILDFNEFSAVYVSGQKIAKIYDGNNHIWSADIDYTISDAEYERIMLEYEDIELNGSIQLTSEISESEQLCAWQRLDESFDVDPDKLEQYITEYLEKDETLEETEEPDGFQVSSAGLELYVMFPNVSPEQKMKFKVYSDYDRCRVSIEHTKGEFLRDPEIISGPFPRDVEITDTGSPVKMVMFENAYNAVVLSGTDGMQCIGIEDLGDSIRFDQGAKWTSDVYRPLAGIDLLKRNTVLSVQQSDIISLGGKSVYVKPELSSEYMNHPVWKNATIKTS